MSYPRLIMTSSQRGTDLAPAAEEMARQLDIEVVARERRSIDILLRDYQADAILVWQEQGPVLHIGGQKFFFHPSMAKARLSMLRKGLINDPMLKAMAVGEGDTVLDCTLGLGADAIVAAFAAGDSGQVTGLEKNPIISAMVAYGLTNYLSDMKSLRAAMQRIIVLNADHKDYLPSLLPKSYDIVYFDPMFRHPVNVSTGIKPLRLLAEAAPLEPVSISEAIRVAKKRVVVKERSGSAEFARLGCSRVEGSASSPLAYGIIETGR